METKPTTSKARPRNPTRLQGAWVTFLDRPWALIGFLTTRTPLPSLHAAWRAMHRFLGKIEAKLGHEVSWAACPENQKRGALHFQVLLEAPELLNPTPSLCHQLEHLWHPHPNSARLLAFQESRRERGLSYQLKGVREGFEPDCGGPMFRSQARPHRHPARPHQEVRSYRLTMAEDEILQAALEAMRRRAPQTKDCELLCLMAQEFQAGLEGQRGRVSWWMMNLRRFFSLDFLLEPSTSCPTHPFPSANATRVCRTFSLYSKGPGNQRDTVRHATSLARRMFPDASRGRTLALFALDVLLTYPDRLRATYSGIPTATWLLAKLVYIVDNTPVQIQDGGCSLALPDGTMIEVRRRPRAPHS